MRRDCRQKSSALLLVSAYTDLFLPCLAHREAAGAVTDLRSHQKALLYLEKLR